MNMKNNAIADVPVRNDKQDKIRYTIDKRAFIVTPVYKKSGENISKILSRLMQAETEKP